MIYDYHKIAIVDDHKEISYTDLIHNVHEYAESLPVTKGEKRPQPIQKDKNFLQRKFIILSENRLEYVYAVFAIWQKEGIVVPIDASSTVSDLSYILNDCTPEAIFVSETTRQVAEEAVKATGSKAEILSISAEQRLGDNSLKSSEHIDSTSGESAGEEEPFTFRHLNNGSASVMPELHGDMADTVCLIVYTSGTTGSPKGVMLTFRNIYANIIGVSEEVPIYTSERRALILLPLHHILPLMGCLIAPILTGGGVAIAPSMTAKDIMDTLCRGKVGIFIGVPRLWQTLYGGIMKKINEKAVTRALYAMCAKAQSRALSRTIFSSIRKMMGGHLDICVSGGAALDREISQGIKTLGLDLLEGYGMSETAPIITFTRPDDIIPGCVGKPLPSMECKLIDPETGVTLNHKTMKPGSAGELCAKGPNVMKGYYNRPQETAAVIDKEGYIHTGDLAVIDSENHVTITGRCKEIIVLSNGKNVQPYEIEYQLEKYDDLIKEVAVTERDDKLVAIIVPQNDSVTEEQLKTTVLQPYNKEVENYKKIMSIFIYHGELPRTKLDKLQRFKLKAILDEGNDKATADTTAKGDSVTETLTEEFKIIRDYIQEEKKITVKPTDHIETDLAFDSLDKVGLQSFIEQTFGMTINADTMADYKDVQTIADKVAAGHTKMEVEKVDWHKILDQEASKSRDLEKARIKDTHCTHSVYSNLFKAFFKSYNRMTVKGCENIPSNGPFILAPNHQSFLDAPLAMAGVPQNMIDDVYFYATEEHVRGKFMRYMASHHNVVVMEKANLKDSIVCLAEVLRQGKSIMIFPEGTRTHTGQLSEFKKTFAILAKELNVPIIPVRLTGAFRMLKRGTYFIQPCHVQVEYLKPVIPDNSLTYEEITKIVKDRIQGD